MLPPTMLAACSRQVARAVEVHDFRVASISQQKLARRDWEGCKCWIGGLRLLLRMARAAQPAPEELVGSPVACRASKDIGHPALARPFLEEQADSEFADKTFGPCAVGVAGRRFALHELDWVRSALDAALEAAVDIEQRTHAQEEFNELMRQLRDGEVQDLTSQAILRLASAVRAHDVAAFRRAQQAIVRSDWERSKVWLTALRMLFTQSLSRPE